MSVLPPSCGTANTRREQFVNVSPKHACFNGPSGKYKTSIMSEILMRGFVCLFVCLLPFFFFSPLFPHFFCLSIQVFNHCHWLLKCLSATLFPPLTFRAGLTPNLFFWVIKHCSGSHAQDHFPLKQQQSLSAYVHLHQLFHTHKQPLIAAAN